MPLKLVPVSYIKVVFSHPSNCCICFPRGGVNLNNLLIRDLNYKRRHWCVSRAETTISNSLPISWHLCAPSGHFTQQTVSQLSATLLSPPLVWGGVKGVSRAELQHRVQGTKLKAAQENARVHPALGKVHSATPEIASHMKTVFVRWEMNCSRRNRECMNHDCFWFENIQDFLCEHFPSAWICRCDGRLKLTDSHSRKFPHLVWEVLWESKESFSCTF